MSYSNNLKNFFIIVVINLPSSVLYPDRQECAQNPYNGLWVRLTVAEDLFVSPPRVTTSVLIFSGKRSESESLSYCSLVMFCRQQSIITSLYCDRIWSSVISLEFTGMPSIPWFCRKIVARNLIVNTFWASGEISLQIPYHIGCVSQSFLLYLCSKKFRV